MSLIERTIDYHVSNLERTIIRLSHKLHTRHSDSFHFIHTDKSESQIHIIDCIQNGIHTQKREKKHRLMFIVFFCCSIFISFYFISHIPLALSQVYNFRHWLVVVAASDWNQYSIVYCLLFKERKKMREYNICEIIQKFKKKKK